MAEPSGAVELRDTATRNGAVAKGDPDVLFTQIEQTREDLARTIDTLAERVSPANNVERARAKFRSEISRPDVQLAAGAGGLALAGLVVLSIWIRHRRHR